MASGFVSGGIVAGYDVSTPAAPPPQRQHAPSAASPSSPPAAPASTSTPNPSVDGTPQPPREAPGPGPGGSKHQAEWEAVSRSLAAERQQREESRRAAAEGGGEKSLYDILQENKAAKQEAFEEQTRIRNQFRALDDDEIDFLDGVLAAARGEEARVRRETEDGLRRFREAQAAAEKAARGAAADTAPDGDAPAEWAAPGARAKRKREREGKGTATMKGLKRRASDTGSRGEIGDAPPPGPRSTEETSRTTLSESAESPAGAAGAKDRANSRTTDTDSKPKLGLVQYGSDDDDDDDD